MPRCARCLSSSPNVARIACASCNWRSARRSAHAGADAQADGAAWLAFRRRVEGPEDTLRSVRLFAMLLGEDGHAAAGRAGAALEAGDISGYNVELLRLTDKLLDRIHEL